MLNERYQRNLGLFGEDGQKKILNSHVAIVGAGGLGGSVLENLLRAGVGRMTVIDHDVFEPSNLNRQILSRTNNIGQSKALAAKNRAIEINPDTELIAISEKLSADNASVLLKGSHLVCDCIDSIETRFVIQLAAAEVGIPMVHAAVAGSTGQLLTVFPGDAGLRAIYGDPKNAPKKGEEQRLGTPPTTVSTIAAFQAHEAICIIAGIQKPLRNTLLRIDLGCWKIERFTIDS